MLVVEFADEFDVQLLQIERFAAEHCEQIIWEQLGHLRG